MKKWAAPILVILAALSILPFHSASPGLLLDSDTAVLLRTIREKNDPGLWFRGDWPLYNHFYRPISTLAFEMDNRLYGNWGTGYGWTNAFLVALAVALLGWFAFEITGQKSVAAATSIVFALWVNQFSGLIAAAIGCFGFVALAVGLWRNFRRPLLYLPGVLALWYLADEASGMQPLWFRTVGWIPGRTATTMTVFCFIAMASYARWERLSPSGVDPNGREPEPITPLTPPATRSTKIGLASAGARPANGGWLLLSAVAVALALGSYEQAVMLPACLLAIGIGFRLQKMPPRRGWIAFHGVAWALLFAYVGLRHQILPAQTSAYQNQQLRFGAGVWLALSDYIYPFGGQWLAIRSQLEMGGYLLLTAFPLQWVIAALKPIAAAYTLPPRWQLPFTAWGLSIIAFFPMAWVQHFDHYHFWPMALRALFVTLLAPAVGRATLTAVSPRAEVAPPRSHPAPGSLPRP